MTDILTSSERVIVHRWQAMHYFNKVNELNILQATSTQGRRNHKSDKEDSEAKLFIELAGKA
ncbi:hypothetical protein E2C01_015210 [Portunus trituberculatus]|uniref:Uncharacterized protein n=1 Tax=Portunus trituberculatus TaxID=210409 RepID=A0A5B7DL24_PORTR|nr:hypothetical protein [Portunus trituberculatus]